jgi:hypothetical protein
MSDPALVLVARRLRAAEASAWLYAPGLVLVAAAGFLATRRQT